MQEEEGFDLGMKFVGYLFLLTRNQYKTLSSILVELQRRGLRYELLDTGFLEEKLGIKASVTGDEEAELMGLEDIHVGVYVREAGIMRPEKLVDYYYSRLKEMGVKFMFNTRVEELVLEPKNKLGLPYEPLPWQEAMVVGAKTAKGVIRAKRKIVVAAVARTFLLLDPIGVDVHSKPKKRQVFAIKASTNELKELLYIKGLNEYNVAPMMILPKGVYVRPVPEENSFWVGVSDHLGRPFKWEEDPQPEQHFYIYGIYPVLHTYLPQFTNARPEASWAGLYDISIDSQPVIFEVAGMIVAAGTSGSGIMKADAIGRIVAAIYSGEKTAELYGGEKFHVEDLGLTKRRVEEEKLVI